MPLPGIAITFLKQERRQNSPQTIGSYEGTVKLVTFYCFLIHLYVR